MAPIRRTTSPHDIVWISDLFVQSEYWSACRGRCGSTYVWDVEKVGIEVVHVNEVKNSHDVCHDLPDIEGNEEDEE